MPKVTFILNDGTTLVQHLPCGQSIMEAATRHGISDILAECGGACMCATCHVYIEAGADALPVMGADEDAMLNESMAERQASSRLACQIQVTDAIDGLVIRVARNQ